MSLFDAILTLALSAAPWVLLGLLAAALVHALLPPTWAQRWLGGNGSGSLLRAAILGAPLPLCSCGAIPTALALHRGGAGRGASTAFLVSTPGVGVDAVALTWALLGPLMTVARVIGAFVTAIATGLAVSVTEPRRGMDPPTKHANACDDPEQGSTGCATAGTACCEASGTCANDDLVSKTAVAHRDRPSLGRRMLAGLRYAFVDLLDNIGLWLAGGLVLGGVLIAVLPPNTLVTYTEGWTTLIVMALIGIPLYLCAAAATPIAVGLMAAGVSPGAALVFLIAAPVTSLATLGVFRREFGGAALAAYLITILASTVLIGATLDTILRWMSFEIPVRVSASPDEPASWLAWLALLLLGLLIARRPVLGCLNRMRR